MHRPALSLLPLISALLCAWPAAALAASGPTPDTLGRSVSSAIQLWVDQSLPPLFGSWKLWHLMLWQWVTLVGMLLLAYLFARLTARLVLRLLVRLSSLTSWKWDDELARRGQGPMVVAMIVLGFIILLPFLGAPPRAHAVLLALSKLVAILAAGWFLVRLVDVSAEYFYRHCQERDDDMGQAMVPVARKILKPIIVVIVLIVALQNVGMNVAGLIAGLGIGGLAVALAAKSTLENVLGSIVISFDRPFKIGDFIQVGDLLGTVEDVGLRSTRVRTLNRTVVTIPNSQLADSRVENYSRRDRIRFLLPLSVQYDTSWDQVRYMVDEIKRYLLSHPRVWQEGFSVRFVGFGDHALNLEAICYVTTEDWGEFTGIREAMLFELGEIVQQAGAQFAFPSQTVYVGKDSQADAKRAKQARAAVEERREQGELSLPEIPEALRAKLLRPSLPAEG